MYLPLRYWARVGFENRRNPETEAKLALIGAAVEEKLWTAACTARKPAGLEGELVDLVLGEGTPLRAPPAELKHWEARYLAIVKTLTVTWPNDRRWSRWTAMALHVASFYLDLALMRTAVECERCMKPELKRRLATQLSPETTALVELWFSSIAAERDGGGLPMVGRSKDGGRKLNVRTPTELLLLRSGEPHRSPHAP